MTSLGGNYNDGYVRVPLPEKLATEDMSDSDPEFDGSLDNTASPPDHGTTAKSKYNLWNIEFYQQYFDVDTTQVLHRLLTALLPHPRMNITQKVLRPRVDLYGPFWIATTLILASAIGGNVSNYLQSHGQFSTSWHYDFTKVTLATTVIYLYWWLMPLGICAILYIRSTRSTDRSGADDDQNALLTDARSARQGAGGNRAHYFAQLLSIYGYSLAVFIPISALWTIPNTVFQWVMVAPAIACSNIFLMSTLSTLFQREEKKFLGPLLMCLLVLNAAFSIGLMMGFFRVSPTHLEVASVMKQSESVVAAAVKPPPA